MGVQSSYTNAETTRICWESVRKLQGAHAGQRSSKSYAILKENEELATEPDEICDRWQQHFERVLNIPSTYQEVVSKMPQLPMPIGLDDPPTAEELDTAFANSKLQKHKAAGMTEISPEMIITAWPNGTQAAAATTLLEGIVRSSGCG